MAQDDGPAERTVILLTLATLLFAGGLRAFLSDIYYHNLTDLGLNATALYSLALLAPLAFLLQPLRDRPRTILLLATLALALSRALLAPTRGTALHLPLAGLSTASYLMILGALLDLIRREHTTLAAAGIALGWALDIALLAYADSADPTATMRGLILVLPIGAVMLLAASQVAPGAASWRPAGSKTRATWAAGAALGVWIFLENNVLGNAYGAARWNGADPRVYILASLAGLVVGSVLAMRAPVPRAALVVLHVALALAVLDHAFVHSRVLPILFAAGQVAMALDAALLLSMLAAPSGSRALVLTGLVALVLHFAFAFTFLFAYVPLGGVWEGQAPLLLALAALALFLVVARRAWELPDKGAHGPRVRRALALATLPALLGAFAVATPAAAIPAPRDDGSFRVLSFNVHQGFANDGTLDPEALLAVVREEDADIVVLQEADTPRFTSGNVDMVSYLAARAGYHPIYGQPTSAQAFGGAILTRFPLEEWSVHELPSDSDDRYFTEARIAIGGRDVWIYAIHFTLPRESRIAERDALLAQAATRGGTQILAGDFNSCPTMLCPSEERGTEPDDVHATLAARYVDPWVTLGNDANATEAFTYEATRPDQRIDYILMTPDISVTSYATVRTPAAIRASDHLPVRADLMLR